MLIFESSSGERKLTRIDYLLLWRARHTSLRRRRMMVECLLQCRKEVGGRHYFLQRLEAVLIYELRLDIAYIRGLTNDFPAWPSPLGFG